MRSIFNFPVRAFITYQQLSTWLLEVFGKKRKRREGKGGEKEKGGDVGTEILASFVDRAQLEKMDYVLFSLPKKRLHTHKFLC